MSRDKWAEWLAERRFGGDPDVRRRLLAELSAVRDKVLDLAELSVAENVLDVGCGEGLIAFGALARGAGTTIFADVSSDVLDFCHQAASDLGLLDRCRFLEAPADRLRGIDDESVDVVTTRSVLIYVDDKRAALNEFARVLRPGGRISLYEPINRFAFRGTDTWAGYDVSPVSDIGQKLRAVYDAIQPCDSDPMLNFDERDLIKLTEEAGFFPIRLLLEAEIRRTDPRRWDSFVRSSGNPKIPTLAEAMDQTLNPIERERLTDHLRPLVEQGLGEWRLATAYLVATKPEPQQPIHVA